MRTYKVYKGSNLPNTFLVLDKDDTPETTVPFNLLYLFGTLTLTKGAIKASFLPFSRGSQAKLAEAVEGHGYCFYKWPGKILGPGLGDLLESEGVVIPMGGAGGSLPAVAAPADGPAPGADRAPDDCAPDEESPQDDAHPAPSAGTG
ncbi:MAG: hypothetical protein H0S85_07565 [Desulfovibrionaceae bacterium]|jgi:hypothetical protein|nr:hypothetical protein [Desulfovibrionaceae bacterium]